MLSSHRAEQSRTVRHREDSQPQGGAPVRLLRRPPQPHGGPRLHTIDNTIAKPATSPGRRTRCLRRRRCRSSDDARDQGLQQARDLNKGKPSVLVEDFAEKPERDDGHDRASDLRCPLPGGDEGVLREALRGGRDADGGRRHGDAGCRRVRRRVDEDRRQQRANQPTRRTSST